MSANAPPPRSLAVLPIPSGATNLPGSPPVGGPAIWSSIAAYAVNAQAAYSAGGVPETWYNVKCVTAVSAPGPNPPPISSFSPLVLNSSWVLQNNGEPAFVIGTIYTPGDVVSFGGSAYGAAPPLYMCVVKTAASPADQPLAWKALATGSAASLSVSSAPASGITVTEPTLGAFSVATNLTLADGCGLVTGAGSGTAQTLATNLTTAIGCGLTKTPSVVPGNTGLGLSLNLAVPTGGQLTLTPSVSDTKTTVAFSVGPTTGWSGVRTTTGVNSASPSPSGILPTAVNGVPITAGAVIMVTPNTPTLDAGTPLTWNLVWTVSVWTIVIDQASSTVPVTFTYVILAP